MAGPTTGVLDETQHQEHQGAWQALRQLWARVGLDRPTLELMFRGACPTFVAIAIYQSQPVAHAFGALGYMCAIVAQLSLCIRPRAIFLEAILVNALGTAFACALSLLASWCVIQARQHTSPVGALAGYNSSACAVSAMWLLFSVWMASTFRAFRPQYRLSVILYLIYSEINIMEAVTFESMAQVISFKISTLKVFFTAYGLATASNLFIFPNTSRTVWFDDLRKYSQAMQSVVKAQQAYVAALSSSDLLHNEVHVTSHDSTSSAPPVLDDFHKAHAFLVDISDETKALQTAKTAMLQLHGKLFADLKWAKREVAYSKLGPKDLTRIYRHLRLVVLPLSGLASLPAIFEHLVRIRVDAAEVSKLESPDPSNQYHIIQQDVWRDLFQHLQTAFHEMDEFVADTLTHILLVLGIDRRPADASRGSRRASEHDLEAKADTGQPGSTAFANELRRRADDHAARKGFLVSMWKEKKHWSTRKEPESTGGNVLASMLSQRDQEQLLLVLYVQHLAHATYHALIHAVDFAEGYRDAHKRLQLPGRKRLQKWFRSMFSADHSRSAGDAEEMQPASSPDAVGESFGKRRDPEHLAPTNQRQKVGDHLRTLGHLLASPQSGFGLRAAVAVMSVAIVGYLERTQTFFFHERCLWAMIIVAVGMNPTSGSSISNFTFRLTGTALAVVVAIVNWYMVDGKTPAVLVFLFVFNFIEMYGLVKYPRYTGVFMVMVVTRVLVVGYQLQVGRVGQAALASAGPYYPVYLLGPYRLAAVATGSFVSFFWTIFPAPVTARSALRKNLGHSLFLLATFYSCMHSTVEIWMAGLAGSPHDKQSPGHRLDKARHRIYSKQTTILASIDENSSFLAWEPTIGGSFPTETYKTLIKEIGAVQHSLVMIAYAASESEADDRGTSSSWLENLSHLSASIDFTARDITTLLSLLSSSVTTGQPLPPYLKPPQPYGLLTKLKATDPALLRLDRAEDVGYSAFAVMEINSALLSDGLTRLVSHVRTLVGEVEFAFAQDVKRDAVQKIQKAD